jgi:hypothetical protein
MTTLSNLHERRKLIPWSTIPPTLQDAMSLTRALGFRYIWIDALCIIQGDTVDFERESNIMHQIYSGAALVICATGSRDVNAGLFWPQPATESFELDGYNITMRPFMDHEAITMHSDSPP